MKKFRSVTVAAVALTTALALSACTPPNQKDGGQREDTATTGPATPSIQSTEKATGTAEATEGAEATSESEVAEVPEIDGTVNNAEATASGAASATGAAQQHTGH